MQRNINLRSLRFENLENRRMLAGTVKVFGSVIEGDGVANNIIIQQVGKVRSDGLINIRVQGIGTKLLVAKYSPNDGILSGFYSATSAVVTAFGLDITLGGGNDTLTVYNTTLLADVDINMGSGNDTVVLNNVRDTFPGFVTPPILLLADDLGLFKIDMGTGNDTVVLNNVSVGTNFAIYAGDGRDTVVLNRVAAGTIKTVVPTSEFYIDMGPGNSDLLTIENCTGDAGFFGDTGGTNGMLFSSGNHFNSETQSGFVHTISL